MLAQKYLAAYHTRTYHEIEIPRDKKDSYKEITQQPVSHWLVNLLFRLRAMNFSSKPPADIGSMGFHLLEEMAGKEIAYGIVSSRPTFGSCLEKFTSEEFCGKYKSNFLRGVIVFGERTEGEKRILFTETRVHCGNKRIQKRFKIYWFFVKPFSSLIRRLLLKNFAAK